MRNLLLAHLLGCTLLGLYAYVAGRSGGRLDGVGGPGIDDANTLGMYFATGAITAIGLLLLVERGWRRWLSFGCLAFVVNGLILTNTRGASDCSPARSSWRCARREHRRTFWLLAAVGALGTSLLIDEKFIDRMSTIQEAITDSQDADFSAATRMTLATAQMEMFRDYPMGSGWRGTATLSPKYLEEKYLSGGGRSSHATFLTALVEQGFLGAILYVWLTLWTVRAIYGLRLRQRDASPQFVSLAATISAVLAVVFAAGTTADFLMAEVQYWMLAALISTIGLAGKHSSEALGSVRVRSDRTVAEGPSLRTLPLPARAG